jgi:hypothetical protein
MGADKEWKRLCELYAEKSDEDLLDLHENRDGLTDTAQQALAQVMKDRSLSPQPLTVESRAAENASDRSSVEGEEDELLDADEVCVYTFDDAFQATQALQHLRNAGIEHRVVDWNESVQKDPRYRSTVRLGVIVYQDQEQAAKAVLQEAMGLFPAPEGDDPFAELAGLMQVGVFERADALIVAHVLGEAGLSYVWNDARDDRNATNDTVSIEVRGVRLELAQKLVEEHLSAMPLTEDRA